MTITEAQAKEIWDANEAWAQAVAAVSSAIRNGQSTDEPFRRLQEAARRVQQIRAQTLGQPVR